MIAGINSEFFRLTATSKQALLVISEESSRKFISKLFVRISFWFVRCRIAMAWIFGSSLLILSFIKSRAASVLSDSMSCSAAAAVIWSSESGFVKYDSTIGKASFSLRIPATFMAISARSLFFSKDNNSLSDITLEFSADIFKTVLLTSILSP